MTKALTSFCLALFLCAAASAGAQQSVGGTPVSFLFADRVAATVPTVKMPFVDVAALVREDEERALSLEKVLRFGAELPVQISPDNAGLLELLPGGDRLWRVAIESSGATSLNFIFSKFHLPAGAQLFIYNADRTSMIGAFTDANNQDDERLGTTLLRGDRVTVEYYEPADAAFRGRVEIGTVVHGYRTPGETIGVNERGFGASGSCNINVNCTLGDGWGAQKRSAVKIINGGDWCSGAMINNTNNNGTPYMLTANHCYRSNVSTWVYWFNWQAPTCANPSSSPAFNSLTGSSLKARRSDVDFCLLQLSSTPPLTYDVFYSGWNRGTAAATQTTGIHHPSGDIKKISRDNNAATNGASSGWGTDHWRVYWDQGVTEGGSSGSPLYDQNQRIVGQLHGGASACGNSPSALWDEYGKFSLSWSGSSASKRLRDWLDPSNSNATTNDGWSPTGNYSLAGGSNANVGSDAADYTYDIFANVGWQAESLTPWITVEAADVHAGVLRVRFDANPALTTRTGYVRLSGPGTESIVSLTQFGVGSKNLREPSLASVFPNPTTGTAFVEIREKGLADIAVFDVNGRLVVETRAYGRAELNLGDQPNGLYLVRVMIAGKVSTVRLLLQR